MLQFGGGKPAVEILTHASKGNKTIVNRVNKEFNIEYERGPLTVIDGIIACLT